MLFIEIVHESLDKGQSLAGAEQQVAFDFALQVDPIRSLLLKINVIDIESLAPSGVKVRILFSWNSFERGFLWVEAAVMWVQMSQSGVVVGVDVGQMHLRKTRLCQSDLKKIIIIPMTHTSGQSCIVVSIISLL